MPSIYDFLTFSTSYNIPVRRLNEKQDVIFSSQAGSLRASHYMQNNFDVANHSPCATMKIKKREKRNK